MPKVRVELNHNGVKELLRSPEMQEIVHEHAQQIASRAGTGYAADKKLMPGRAIASAFTETPEAMRDTLENNTLLKAVR